MLNRLCTDQVQSPLKPEMQVAEQAECCLVMDKMLNMLCIKHP